MARPIKLVLVALVVFLASAAWYWYDLRPANVRRDCGNQVLENLAAAAKGSNVDAGAAVDAGRLSYELCLHRHGLNQ